MSGSTPRLKVRQAWGSRSTSSTRWPASANAAPSEATEVVLATPPFWLARAMIVALRFGAMGAALSDRRRGRPDPLIRRGGARTRGRSGGTPRPTAGAGGPSTHASPTSRCARDVGERQEPGAGEGGRHGEALRGHDGDAETGRDETADGRQVLGLHRDGGMKPAARQRSSVCWRIPEGGARRTNGSSATSARATSERPASGWSVETARTNGSSRTCCHTTPWPATRAAVSSRSARRVASWVEMRPSSPTAVRSMTTRTRGCCSRKAPTRPGTSQLPRLRG